MTTHEKLPEAIQSFGDRVAELMAENGISACMLLQFGHQSVHYRVLAYDEAEADGLQAVAEMVMRDLQAVQSSQRSRLMGKVAGHG